MPSIQSRHEQNVCIVELCDGENKLNQTFLDQFHRLLDEVEGSQGPDALVTIAEGKYWSTGIDLEWLTQQAPTDTKHFVQALERLLCRVLLLPMPTAAAINGHVFAGGALLAMAHDYRVMRADRGWFCLPEVDIKIPFTRGMMALLRDKLTSTALRDAVLTGARFGADDAQRLGIVDGTAPSEELLRQTLSRLEVARGKDRGIVGQLKKTMYAHAATHLGTEPQG